LDNLAKIRIPGEAMQMLLFVVRKTYGFNKTHDGLATSQIMTGTGLSRKGVERARSTLRKMNLIGTDKKRGTCYLTYAFNKHYKTWITTRKKEGTPKKRGMVPLKTGTRVPPITGNTKDNVTKDTLTKEIKIPAQSAASFEEPVENPKQVSLKEIELKGQDDTVKHKIFNQVVDLFTTRGWKTETEYLKRVFKAIVLEMEGYNPKEFFPYFRKVANNYVNKNSEIFAADARIVRGQERKLGITCAGVTV
jgi:phage replication O-like protein O